MSSPTTTPKMLALRVTLRLQRVQAQYPSEFIDNCLYQGDKWMRKNHKMCQSHKAIPKYRPISKALDNFKSGF